MSVYDLDTLGLDNLPELHILPADSEAQVMISSVQEGLSGNSGLAYWLIRLTVVGDELAKEITYFATVPDRDKQEPRRFLGTANAFNAFLKAFGVSGAVDPENDLVGKTAYAILKVKDDGEYGMKNEVKKWVG